MARQPFSGFVPTIQFRTDANLIIRDALVNPRVKAFFGAQSVTHFSQIDASEVISPRDFKDINIKYIYNVLLDELGKRGNPSNFATFAITHDKLAVTEECSVTGTRFSTIRLGEHPFFFFIFIDLQDIFDVLSQHDLHKPSYK